MTIVTIKDDHAGVKEEEEGEAEDDRRRTRTTAMTTNDEAGGARVGTAGGGFDGYDGVCHN